MRDQREHFVVSSHAETRAKQRHIDQSAFREASREALRSNLHDQLIEQQRKLQPMLTDKPIHAKVGPREYKASNCEISTRLDLNGTTFVVGIRREGEGYTPLTVATAWN